MTGVARLAGRLRPDTVGRRLAWAAALALLGGGTWLLLTGRTGPAPQDGPRPPPELAADRVAIAPLVNRTGDSTLDPLGTLAADWLTRSLGRGTVIRPVPVTATLGTLRTLAPGGELLPRLGEETGAAFVLGGEIVRRGDSLALEATLVDARRRSEAAHIGPVVVPADRAWDGVESLRRRATAALAAHMDVRIAPQADVIPREPGAEAYREYVLGLDRFASYDWPGAIDHFRRAAAADSAFPSPALMAGQAAINLGDMRGADSLVKRLAPARGELAEYDAIALDALEAEVRGDHAAAYAAARRAARLAPGTLAHLRVASEALALNRPSEALRVTDSLDPSRGELRGYRPYWIDRALAHHMLGEYKLELDVARQAAAVHPGVPDIVVLELRALAGLGRCAQVASRLEPAAEALGAARLRALAQECAAHGDEATAGTIADRALGLARDFARRNASDQAALAVVEALSVAGRWKEARALADSLLFMLPYDAPLRGRRGIIALHLGDSSTARDVDARLSLADPYPDYGRRSLWRARLAATRGDSTATIALLDKAVREGMSYERPLHADPDLLPVRATALFRAWLRPKE